MKLVGVGVGPGDPDLLTFRARDVLAAADVVFVPVANAPGEGYAERVVRAHLPHATVLRRVVFDLDHPAASWAAAGEEVAAELAAGRTVAFATIGDPNLYSTFIHLARVVRRLRPDAVVETVPGITAVQDLAARSATVLAEGDERVALLPFTAGEDALVDALERFDTVACYKGGRRMADVARAVERTGRAADAVYGARLGLDGEVVRRGLPDGPAPYLSTVVVTRPRQEPR